MAINESGWRDLDARLDSLPVTPEHRDVLIGHVLDRLVGHFGTESVECHLGKSDPQRHAMREVAAAAIAHLAPVLALVSTESLATLIETEEIGSPVPRPWDDQWRAEPRTASWRS